MGRNRQSNSKRFKNGLRNASTVDAVLKRMGEDGPLNPGVTSGALHMISKLAGLARGPDRAAWRGSEAWRALLNALTDHLAVMDMRQLSTTIYSLGKVRKGSSAWPSPRRAGPHPTPPHPTPP